MAAPIDFTTGIITGTYVFHSNALQFKDGAEIARFPIWDFLADSRPYGAQLVQTVPVTRTSRLPRFRE